MKPLYLLAASALALTAAACGPKVPPARAALDCPAEQGDLTRTSVAPDGKTCTYVDSDGAEVTLQLVAVRGGIDATLASIENTLLASRVQPTPAEPATGPAAKAAATSADRAAKEAAEDTKGVDTPKGVTAGANLDREGNLDVDVDVDLSKDGAVVSESDDGTTRVNLPGIHIVANERDDSAKVKVGPITIDAGEDAATIRIRRDVRLRGEALNPERRGMRAMFIYTGHDLPDGYKFVGYEAGGPKRGPITVAVVRAKGERPHDDEIYPDVKKLVRKNGGV